jgi:hypothetical protein
VPASTLREIVKQYASSQTINFLKLDVEGWELEALRGLNIKDLPSHQRPQVILLEVTVPSTRLSASHRQHCRVHLLDCAYKFLFFDGLNDYYCDAHLHSIYEPIMLPPNVFDGPSLLIGSSLPENLAQHDRDLSNCTAELCDARSKMARAFQVVDELKQEFAAQAQAIEELRAELAQRSSALDDAESALIDVTGRLRKLVEP